MNFYGPIIVTVDGNRPVEDVHHSVIAALHPLPVDRQRHRLGNGYRCCVFEVFLRWALVRISSGVFVQMNGWQRSFQPSMNAPMAAMRSLTELNVPRRIACRVMTGEKDFDHVEPGPGCGREVHGDPRVAGQPGFRVGVLVCGVVVGDDVQFHLRVGLGDEFEEVQEFSVGMPVVAGVGDPCR